MTEWRRKTLAWLAVLILVAGAAAPGGFVGRAQAERGGPGAVQLAAGAEREPGGVGMIIDGLVVRPIGFVTTIIGSVVFVITLPFSAAGGNVEQAREKLIDAPAAFTFNRCLGCFGGDN